MLGDCWRKLKLSVHLLRPSSKARCSSSQLTKGLCVPLMMSLSHSGLSSILADLEFIRVGLVRGTSENLLYSLGDVSFVGDPSAPHINARKCPYKVPVPWSRGASMCTPFSLWRWLADVPLCGLIFGVNGLNGPAG